MKHERIILFALIAIFLLPAASCEGSAENTEGPVKSEHVLYDNGQVNNETYYNRSGNRIRYVSYTRDGSVDSERTYTYDTGGSLLEERCTDSTWKRNRYDSQDRLIETMRYDGIDTNFINWAFDDEARRKSIVASYMNYITVEQLDQEGRPVFAVRINSEGDTIGTTRSMWDMSGNEVERIAFWKT